LPDSHFIDGGWAAATAGAMMETYDPGSASPHARFAAGDAEDVARAVDSAARALASHDGLGHGRRARTSVADTSATRRTVNGLSLC